MYPGFILSIWIWETGWGKSPLWMEHNNPAGIKVSETEYASYSSKEEGMKALFELLRIYCDSGRCTIGEIRSVWSESDDTEDIVSVWKQIILEGRENE